MLLLEQSYNHNQSAATLMPVDYGPYTFVESAPTGERVGRDYGLRARGYLAGDHLEYRAGVYQGVRGTNASNDLRFTGRLMYSFFTPPVGLFYRGTSLGKTQTLSFGTSYEKQEDYDSFGFDVFYDQPWGEGNGFTAQADYVALDGGYVPHRPPRADQPPPRSRRLLLVDQAAAVRPVRGTGLRRRGANRRGESSAPGSPSTSAATTTI